MLTLLPFLTKLHESIERLNTRTKAYIKNPNDKHIHDVRTSVRRFNSAFLSLPKKYRTGPILLSEYNQIANKFFKVNSKIRDYDIIVQKLNNYTQSSQRDVVIDSIKKDRQLNLEKAKTLAISLKDLGSNKVIDKMNITEKELQKRYIKVLSSFISKIELNFPIVITNALKIEELHQLRKDCKKMRYMLELLPEENTDAIELKKIFEKIQDHLGCIHDFDITIYYLRSLEPNREIQEIINTETENRRLKYAEFLNFSKRRLHLTRDSFLIRIKSFMK
ncbi:MAG: CHAD domain-containing protein [Nitrososphaeraceae archaeon]